jgi:hypothetical protein
VAIRHLDRRGVHERMGNGFKLRFAVGIPDGPQSSVWSVFTGAGKSDVYVANRQIASILKFSFHESGDWRLAFTEPYASGRVASGEQRGDRVEHRWVRPPETQPGWTHAASILIPVSDLRDYGKRIDHAREISWRSAPGPGTQCVFGIFFVGPGSPRPAFQLRWEPLSAFDLPNGERLQVIAGDTAVTPRQVAEYNEWRAQVRLENGHGYRTMLVGETREGSPLLVDLYSGDE